MSQLGMRITRDCGGLIGSKDAWLFLAQTLVMSLAGKGRTARL